MTVALFIDSNRYLDLYQLISGRRLLDSLEEQQAYIFLSTQIVDEVMRNKLRCAQIFFANKMKEIGEVQTPVPDHLLGIADKDMKKFRQTFAQAQTAKNRLRDIAADALSRISQSEDEVSKRLGVLFDKSILPNPDDIRRARERKERGNPPGKSTDPLGDQIIWEQFLSHCRDKKITRVWIVTKDQDYCVEFGNRVVLNSFLYQELKRICGVTLEAHCFTSLLDGIEHFGKNAGVKAEKLPTKKEAAEIKKEMERVSRLYLDEYLKAVEAAFAETLAQTQRTNAVVPSGSARILFSPEGSSGSHGADDVNSSSESKK